MKTIKIILGIITALVLVFFATGLLVKETNYKAQVSVNESLTEVFTSFNKTDNVNNWIPEIKTVETLNENVGKTGSSYKMKNQNQTAGVRQVQIAYNSAKRMILNIAKGDFPKNTI